MHATQELITNDSDIQQFLNLVQRGIDCWIDAGRLVARKIDEDPEFVTKVCEACPSISEAYIRRFEDIGRSRLHPKLLLSTCPGYARLMRLPYEVQERHLQAPVELLIKDSERVETLQVDVRNLTKLQAEQVFDRDHVRSLAAQRAWLEDRAIRSVPLATADVPYRVVGKKVVVTNPCTITAKELATLLTQLQ